MSATKETGKGFVTNCLLIIREDAEGPMFIRKDGTVIACLDRYAIVPIEKYEELVERSKSQTHSPS